MDGHGLSSKANRVVSATGGVSVVAVPMFSAADGTRRSAGHFSYFGRHLYGKFRKCRITFTFLAATRARTKEEAASAILINNK